MKFILIKRYDDNAIEVDDIVADGFDAAVKTAATDCAENEVDSGLADVSLVHVAAIVDMAPHIERELAAKRLLESAERATAQEAAERAEYERLKAKFEPKKEHVVPLTATTTVSSIPLGTVVSMVAGQEKPTATLWAPGAISGTGPDGTWSPGGRHIGQ